MTWCCTPRSDILCGPHGAGRVEGNFNIFTGSKAAAAAKDILHGSDLI
jgi:hypothetical protein